MERVGAMKKWISLAAAAAVCMTLTTGCSRTVKPGDKAGYDEGEQYLRTVLMNTTMADTSPTWSLFPETTAAAVTPIR